MLTFPIVLTTAWLGRPDYGVIFTGYIGSFMLAGAYLSVGVFTSAITAQPGNQFRIGAGHMPVSAYGRMAAGD